MKEDKVEKILHQIAELKRRWPAHSVPPALVQQLDELEEELEKEQRKRTMNQEEDSQTS